MKRGRKHTDKPSREEPQPSCSADEGNSLNCNSNAHIEGEQTTRRKPNSPTNESVYMSAAKFIEASQLERVGGGNNGHTELNCSSGGSGSSDDSLNNALSDSPESEDSKRIDSLITDLRTLTAKGKKMAGTRINHGTSREDSLTTESIRQCMDHQFEKARQDEIDELILNAEKGKLEAIKPPGKHSFI